MEWEIDVGFPATGIERETSYCILCDENIKNPLCPNCIAKGFKQWIQKLPGPVEKFLRRRTDAFLMSYRILGEDSLTCVSCGKQSTPICPDCFIDYLYENCLEAGLSVSNLREFLLMFDFNFSSKKSPQNFWVYSERH